MRVAIVSPEFPPDIGGVETYAFEYVNELARRGLDVTVFTVRHPAGEISAPGFSVEPVLKLCRSADRITFSRHVANVWHPLNAAYAWVAAELPNGLVSVHGNDFLRPYYPVAQPDLRRFRGSRFWADAAYTRFRPVFDRWTARLVRKALARTPHIIANSRYTERVLVETVPECRGRTSAGFVGVGRHFFDVDWQPAPDTVPRLLTVSRLSEPRKNIDQVLRALARLKGRQAFRYTIVGGGYDRSRLEALAGELQLAERVRFAGIVEQEELLDIYAHSDLMVLASSVIPGSHEGFRHRLPRSGSQRRPLTRRASRRRGRGDRRRQIRHVRRGTYRRGAGRCDR